LKRPTLKELVDRISVAPFTGAWIETHHASQNRQTGDVAPFTGAWIETDNDLPLGLNANGRALYGRVD